MTIAKHLRRAGLALMALSSVSALQSAYAAGTAAGTSISNTATVTYEVGGAAQAPVSGSVSFVVDNLVDVTLAETSSNATTADANEANSATVFTLENTGNKSQQFRLTAVNQATGTASPFGGPSDNQDVSNIRIYQDNGTTANVLDGGDTLIGAGTGLFTLAQDTPTAILVVADMPATPANGDRANVELTAMATNDGNNPVQPTAGADTAGEDIVVDDVSGAAVDQYALASAAITVTKSALVIEDPFNGTTDPKAIPGAFVRYTILVQNNGAADAANLTMADTLPAEVEYRPNTLQLDGSAAGTVTGSDVSVPIPALAAGATATITLEVEIQ